MRNFTANFIKLRAKIMKKLKLLSVIMICGCLQMAGAATFSGKVNKNIVWELRDSVLYVSGTGAIPSYTTTSMARIPWTEDKIARAIVRIEIGEGITEVGNYAFGCLTEVRDTRTESERYTNESDNASIKYYKLRSIKLPSTLKKIGRNAFSKINIKAISLPEGLTEIGYGAFTNCDLRSIKLPSSLRKLGAETFTGCSNLQCVDINDAEIGLGAGVFFDCDKLRMILHTSNLKSVQPSTFNATIFAQFLEAELLDMFRTDGIEDYIATYMAGAASASNGDLTDEETAEMRTRAIDEFYVKEAKNATVQFNLDDISLGVYDADAGTVTLESVNHGSMLFKLSPEQYEELQSGWVDYREKLRPTFHPANGRVKLQFITLALDGRTIVGSLL